ncbi:hypothetical protein A5N86_16080 [Geobacillus thermoleovorans]|nr:hypothetical protein A5N86_16080 [Geobacillus thermoleovorans]
MLKDHYIFSNGRLKRKDNTIYFLDEKENKRSLPVHQIENLYSHFAPSQRKSGGFFMSIVE